jgi:hypothetical protein
MASRYGYVRAPLGAANLHANATQRRAVEGNLGGFCVWVWPRGPGSPQAAAPNFSNAELFRPLRSRTPAAAC